MLTPCPACLACFSTVLCLLPLLYTHLFSSPAGSPFSAAEPSRAKRFYNRLRGKQSHTSAGYEPIGASSDDGNDDDSGVDMSREYAAEGKLKGWKLLLFWFPAVCESAAAGPSNLCRPVTDCSALVTLQVISAVLR